MFSTELLNGELQFFFEKSPSFRNIHVDGAIGAISPGTRFLNMAIFCERTPLPKSIVQEVENGVPGREIEERRVAKVGVQREIEANLIMSYDAAVAVRDWLNQRIAELEIVRQQNV